MSTLIAFSFICKGGAYTRSLLLFDGTLEDDSRLCVLYGWVNTPAGECPTGQRTISSVTQTPNLIVQEH